MSRLFADTVQLLRYSADETDRRGNPVPTWATAVDVPDVVVVSPNSGARAETVTSAGDTARVDVELHWPADGAAVTALDRVVVRGITYEVVAAQPGTVHPRTGRRRGQIAHCARRED